MKRFRLPDAQRHCFDMLCCKMMLRDAKGVVESVEALQLHGGRRSSLSRSALSHAGQGKPSHSKHL